MIILHLSHTISRSFVSWISKEIVFTSFPIRDIQNNIGEKVYRSFLLEKLLQTSSIFLTTFLLTRFVPTIVLRTSSHTISRSFVSFDFERNSVHLFSNSWRTEMISGRRKEESGEERSVSRLGGEGGGKVDRGLSHYARRRPQGLMRERLASARERKPTG